MRLNYNELKQFASDDQSKVSIRQPWKWRGEMWASDDRVLIRTFWDGMQFDQPAADDPSRPAGRSHNKTCSHTWNSAFDFATWEAKPLRRFWTWNDHTARAILPPDSFLCENCGGSGRSPYDPDGGHWDCEECDGRGSQPNTSRFLLHPDCPAVQGQYLTRLATLLPGAVWETVRGHALGKDHEVTVWRITLGETRAILMPFERAHEDMKLVPLFR